MNLPEPTNQCNWNGLKNWMLFGARCRRKVDKKQVIKEAWPGEIFLAMLLL